MSNQAYYKNSEDLRYTPTSPSEEAEFFKKAHAGDQTARDFIIKNHLLFCANRARRITHGAIPDEDVISAVNEVLVKAIDNFEPREGCRFSSYLVPVIKGAVSKLWKLKKESEMQGLPENDVTRDEVAPSPADILAETEDKKSLQRALKVCLDGLTDQERKLLVLVYEHGESLASVARAWGVTRAAVSAAHGKLLEKMKRRIKGGL